MRHHGPHEELTDPQNDKRNATLTSGAWRGLVVEETAARLFQLASGRHVRTGSAKWHPDAPWSLDDHQDLAHLMEAENPLSMLVATATERSGSIGGEYRRDLKEAVIGAPQSVTGVSVPSAPSSQNGLAGRPRGESK